LAEPIPGPTTKRLGDVAREMKITIVASLFERRAPGIYHNTAAVIDTGGKVLGIYRKMHIPDDPLYYEKFYFTQGDLGFKAFETDFGSLAPWSAGTSGIPRAHGSPPFRGQTCSSIPRQSSGIRTRRRNTAKHSTTRGEPFNARTRLRMVFTSPCLIVWVSRRATFEATKRQAKALSSGAGRSLPILSDR